MGDRKAKQEGMEAGMLLKKLEVVSSEETLEAVKVHIPLGMLGGTYLQVVVTFVDCPLKQ